MAVYEPENCSIAEDSKESTYMFAYGEKIAEFK